jgi:SAM-dependent methyltransferase
MIRFSDFTDIQSWRRSIAAETAFTDAAEDFLRTQSEVGGFCQICRRWVRFVVNGGPDFGAGFPNLREGLVCPCGAKSRDRLMTLASRNRLAAAGHVVFFGALSGWAQWAREAHGERILFCEYLGDDVPAGAEVAVEGVAVQNQDMTRMTLPDASTDLILHQDVLEHIPDYRAAFRETLRVLRPGGQTIFTAPLFHALDQTFVRASFDEAGALVHHAEPELHGDPLVPAGILAFYNFGWSLVDDLRAVGFEDVRLRMLYRPDLGIVSNGCPVEVGRMMPVLLSATKPPR